MAAGCGGTNGLDPSASANSERAGALKDWRSPEPGGENSSLARTPDGVEKSLRSGESGPELTRSANEFVTVEVDRAVSSEIALTDEYLRLIDDQYQSVLQCSGVGRPDDSSDKKFLKVDLYNDLVPCDGDSVMGCYEVRETRILTPFSSLLALRHELVHYIQDLLGRGFSHVDPLFDRCFQGVQNLTIRLSSGQYVDVMYEPVTPDDFPPLSVFDSYQQIFEGMILPPAVHLAETAKSNPVS